MSQEKKGVKQLLQIRDMTRKGQGFGTAPVFLTAISTILGAIMFLRFDFAVGNLGMLGAMGVILLGHAVTIPTAMAVSEIATNQRVEGGGEYYMISRSFGLIIGAVIGISLYLSQAISVAFYIIAFAEAFKPLMAANADLLAAWHIPNNLRVVSVPATIAVVALMLTYGAGIGVKLLYVVVVTLFLSLAAFFMGKTGYTPDGFPWLDFADDPASFFTVFAICFPAFTGINAGVGLSGDLRNPGRSIPLGTLLAAFTGLVVYVAIVYKLAVSASPEDLGREGSFMMREIAIWAPAVTIGLASATMSSALGSIIVAPRKLQALGEDGLFPSDALNEWFAKVRGKSNEPVNATMVTSVIAMVFVLIGELNAVATILTMFFMVTYGTICSISFLEHFSGDPSYRPRFRSKWYLSLAGAVMSFVLMFQISAVYAFAALATMVVLYFVIAYYNKDKQNLADIFQGVIFQVSRQMQVFLQKADKTPDSENWRPAIVCVSERSFDNFAAFNMLRWISDRYGFGTYIHLLNGYLSKETRVESKEQLNKLIRLTGGSKSKIFIDTLVTPSFTTAIAQLLQLPGVTGKENNMLMFAFDKGKAAELKDIMDNLPLIKSADFDVCILGASQRNFGFKRKIDVWITTKDYENANMMILMAFVLLGHREWRRASIRVFAVYPETEIADQRQYILEMINAGRLPISPQNVQLIPKKEEVELKAEVNAKSQEADLTMIGINIEQVKGLREQVFTGYADVGDILFVNASRKITIG